MLCTFFSAAERLPFRTRAAVRHNLEMMIHKQYIGVAVVLAVCATSLPAQRTMPPALQSATQTATQPATPAVTQTTALDLAGALTLARTRGPGRAVANARRDISVGQLGEATQLPNPSLEWRQENLGSPLQPDISTILHLPLDITGRRLALRSVKRAGVLRADGDLLAARREAELEVARSWLRAALTSGAQQVAERQFESLREIAVVDSIREREGAVAPAISLRTGLEADRAQLLIATAAGTAARARADLARVLGIPDNELATVAGLAAPPLPLPPDSVRARDLAVSTRPEVAAREAALRETQARRSAERRGVIGDVQLQGGTKQTSGYLTGVFGIAMPLPLFNRNSAAQQRAAGEYAEALALRNEMLIAVGGSVGAAWHAYVATRASATRAATFEARGIQVAQIARAAYSEGHITLTELLDAERAAVDALTASLNWTAEAWLARLELERAIGARLDADSPLDLPLLATLLTPAP